MSAFLARDYADIFVGCRQDVGTMSAADGPFMADARGLTMFCGCEVGNCRRRDPTLESGRTADLANMLWSARRQGMKVFRLDFGSDDLNAAPHGWEI